MTPDRLTAPRPGRVAPELRAEFPGLRLGWLTVPARQQPSPEAVLARLAALADRVTGAGAVALRTKPVPQAFRAFFRQIGLDPDVERPPAERAAVTRLLHGGFRSAGLIGDACLVALLETGVPVWALDAAVVDTDGLGIRTTTAADVSPAARAQEYVEPGTLAVADRRRVHAVLFGEPLAGSAPGRSARRVALFAVGVDGVPDVHVEEALWVSAELILSANDG